jgi:hypothetical protein
MVSQWVRRLFHNRPAVRQLAQNEEISVLDGNSRKLSSAIAKASTRASQRNAFVELERQLEARTRELKARPSGERSTGRLPPS